MNRSNPMGYQVFVFSGIRRTSPVVARTHVRTTVVARTHE